ncbi:MAG: helix-turn-helix transcriptional regulator [Oscillospiraceae bacterium]
MPIKYDKLLALLKEKGFTTYKIRKEKLLGQATLQKIQDGGDIDTRTIAKLCKVLGCQPGDIMEYVEDGGESDV